MVQIDLTATCTGGRNEILRALQDRVEGEEHRGKPHLALAAKAAARLVNEGATSVWVGKTKYVVTED